MSDDYETLYGVRLLDDLHNFFPAILYEPTRFTTVQQLLTYISSRTSEHFNLFNRGQSQFRAARNTLHTNVPILPVATTTIPIIPATRTAAPRAATPHTSATVGLDLVTETFDITSLLPNSTYDPLNIIQSLLGAAMREPGAAMEPVPVAPTAQQLAAGSTIQQADEEAHHDLICSICQEGYTTGQYVRKLNHCSHYFHKACIDPWFRAHVRCPVCRHDIREIATPATQQ
jgi:hypothetical protein